MNQADISLYVILDPERSLGRDLGEIALAAIAGGATFLQLRAKKRDNGWIEAQARRLAAISLEKGVPFVVNDAPQIAKAAGANGVHLGPDDMPPAAARALLGPDAIIGLSVKTVAAAEAAPIDLIDHAFIGGVFDTQSKDNKSAIGMHGWRAVAAVLRGRAPEMKLGAIAGIDAGNVADVIRGGADGLAVISAVGMALDVEAATREIADAIRKART